MDRKDFKAIVEDLYGIYQKFTHDKITLALLEGGTELAAVKVENARCLQKQNQIMSDWDAAGPVGKREIEGSVQVDRSLVGDE